jgi:hypothetical protein
VISAVVESAADVDVLAAHELAGRDVRLHDGRILRLRPMCVADAPQLRLLFEGLSVDDRHLRFFSAFHPRLAYLEHYARMAERGGYGIVAVVEGVTGEELVGEATYSVDESGDAELGITIAVDWRGWLGHYLLDALVAVAAIRGVPHLYADVLRSNREMLALLRARGGTAIGRSDLALTRVVVAAASPVVPVPPSPA